MLNALGADVEEHQVYPHRSDDAFAPKAAMRHPAVFSGLALPVSGLPA